jgi:hypothetical protein
MSGYLERRIDRLDEAITAVDANLGDELLRAQLVADRNRLNTAAPRDVADRAFELAVIDHIASLRLPGGPAALLADLSADPALQALEQLPALTSAAAKAIVQLVEQRFAQGSRMSLTDLPALRIAAGGDSQMDELTGILHSAWLVLADEERPYLERDVAIMLPVRLETLFKQPGLPDDATWEMWLRVIPDEVSICRDDPTPKPIEVAHLEAMWEAIFSDLTAAERAQPIDEWLDSPRGQVEWEMLCSRIGSGRAAWLVSACPPIVVDGAVTVDAPNVGTETKPNRVGGFPPRLEVWIAFGIGPPNLIEEFDVDLDALVFDVVGARAAAPDTTDLTHAKDRWWVSWPSAQAVGLGRIIQLPAGQGPADIRTIFVVGLGEENPADHFRAQIDAGEMAVLPLGAPTNAVDAVQAANLGHDAGDWRAVARSRIRERGSAAHSETELTRSLAGLGAQLQAMPTPKNAIPDLQEALVNALWPVLWGHQLRDIWGCVEEADRLAGWAHRYLRPEGTLPPIRIDQQPYGLLPTSALSLWKIAGEEGSLAQFEERLKPGLETMRAHWAAAARSQDTAVGANTQQLLDLIARDAVSASYAYRPFLATELWTSLLTSIGGGDQNGYDDWIRLTFQPVYDLLQRQPDKAPGIRQYVSFDTYEELTIPLVVPNHWPITFYEVDGAGSISLNEQGEPVMRTSVEQSFVQLLQALLTFGFRYDTVMELWQGILPDSLLVRLLLQANVLSAAAVVQVNAGPPAPLRELLVGDSLVPTLLASLSQQYDPAAPHNHPAGEVRSAAFDGLERLAKMIAGQPETTAPMAKVERAFRATLDTAMYRIDPWIVGMAARRLEYLRNRPESRFRLGVYGWVDGPMLGAPGPTDGGLIHAPSYAQALTAAILRDKQISERLEVPAPPDGRDLWSMQLESKRIRLVEELAGEVRLGSHIYEVFGRQVERIVGVRTPLGDVVEGTSRVDVLRTVYPIKKDQLDRGRVCHGIDALAGLLDSLSPPLAITPEQRNELHLLREVLDAYGDLLVAEAVHQVVSGHAELAGAAMDAAAGLGRPPTLDFSETPLAGDGLSTAVLCAIPYRPSIEPDAEPSTANSPARLVDASVAAALEELLGAADSWTWQWQSDDGEIRIITLAELGLTPVDTLVLSPRLLDDLARAAMDLDVEAQLNGSGQQQHGLARDIVRAFGSQPTFLRDVSPTTATAEEITEVRDFDATILKELRMRYAALHSTAQIMVDELKEAREADDPDALRQTLFRALRWGVTPLSEGDQLRTLCLIITRGIFPEDHALVLALAQKAEESLRERLAAAPAVESNEPMARAIAELAAPSGQLAVLSRITAATLIRISRLDVDSPDAVLDTDWLTIVASVRPRLAWVETLQLQALPVRNGAVPAFPGFASWSSAPGDPWLTATLSSLRQRRHEPGGNDPRLVMPRFVAAYTTGDVWQGGAVAADVFVAVGLIDSWSEAVPRAGQRTTAVFGFNAPAARPPQAILLAVPPDLTTGPGAALDTAGLIQILEETRELAHARAADAEQLGTYLAAVPTTMFGGTGRTSVRLDPDTSFPS